MEKFYKTRPFLFAVVILLLTTFNLSTLKAQHQPFGETGSEWYLMQKTYDSPNPQHSQRPGNTGNQEKETETVVKSLKIYPNPTENFTTFSWELDDKLEKASLIIMNASGQIVKTQFINQSIGQFVLDTRPLPGGIYLYQLISNGNQLAVGRLTIQK